MALLSMILTVAHIALLWALREQGKATTSQARHGMDSFRNTMQLPNGQTVLERAVCRYMKQIASSQRVLVWIFREFRVETRCLLLSVIYETDRTFQDAEVNDGYSPYTLIGEFGVRSKNKKPQESLATYSQ